MNNKGCLIPLVVIALLALLAFGIGYASDQAGEAAYQQAQGEALVIRAQAEARLTAATAQAITTAALLPWGVLLVLGVLGMSIVALSAAIVVTRPRQQPPQIIERQILYLPPPGQPRRDTWQALSAEKFISLECIQKNKNEQYITRSQKA
jgi:hypothetical protein